MRSKFTHPKWRKFPLWIAAAVSFFLVTAQQSVAQNNRPGKISVSTAPHNPAVPRTATDAKLANSRVKGTAPQNARQGVPVMRDRVAFKTALSGATTKQQQMGVFSQFGYNNFYTPPTNEAYCNPVTSSASFEFITNVTYAGINNSTGGGAGAPKDYTSQVATVTQGQLTSISVTIDPDGGDYVWAFIDWNHNEVWDLATERYLVVGNTGAAGPHTAPINVPAGALTGPTRMRVAVVWGSAAPADNWNGCTSYTFGEIEDYTVNVLPNTACSGTPTPGNTISSVSSACAGATVNLSLQNSTGSGATYQWQSGPSATGPWTNVGTNAPTYSTSITANTWFQAVVTCGANSGTSTPVQVSLNPFYLCYCAAGSPDMTFEKISNVTYGTINNNSSSTAGYENFSAISTNAIRSAAMPISVSISNAFAADQVLVWIDLNQNGSFADAGELVFTSALGVGPHTGSITIPATALLGTTGMRVRLHDTSLGPNSTPCGNSSYGQVEDYTVNIVPCPAGTGTPVPGNTISSSGTGFCVGTAFTLSVQNPNSAPGTYQWQSSPDGVTWTNIAGANNPTLTTTISTATYFHLVVTSCNGNVGTSSSLQLTQNPFLTCYCIPPPDDCTDDDVITRFTISTLNNASSCSPNGFGDYKSLPPTPLYIGVTHPVSVTTPGTWPDGAAMWVDYNRNGLYELSEAFRIGDNLAAPVISNNYPVPANATTGITGMRVRLAYNFYPDPTSPCDEISGFGETEEYLVDIQPCVPVTITTHPANVSAACGANSATFTVATSGSLPSFRWQYRTSATGVWNDLTNTGVYSGTTTATLTVSPVTAALNGYQYRAVVGGGCSGLTPSNAATLTVTPYIATVTPTSASVCNGAIQQLSITNSLGDLTVWTENFDGTALPTGWATQNNSEPLGPQPWQQGASANFPAYNGGGNSYYMALWSSTTTTGVGTISNWLFTPVTSFKNGDQFKFYTRTATGSTWPDRIEVRISTNGASTNVGTTSGSVGDFTTVLLTINQGLTVAGYPQTWTEYTATVSGVTGTVSGRAAFRYWVTDGGGNGTNSNVVGIDNVRFIQTGATATGTWTGPAGTIFTNAAGTTPYTAGSAASTVYVIPTVAGVNNYSVTVVTPLCTSTAVTIPVTVNNPITGASTVNNATICVGGNATFTATAPTSGNNIVHQWQVKIGAAPFVNVANGGVYAGATTNTLTITGATAAMNGNIYRDSMSVAACNSFLLSSQGTLTVNPLPVLTITANPNTGLYPGQTTTLTVASSTTVPAGGYQWYRNGVLIPGATGNTILVDVDGLGEYSVTANDANSCGNAVTPKFTVASEANEILFIYPSPNSGQFQVRYYSAPGNNPLPRYLNVYDSKGSRVYSRLYPINAPYSRMDVDLSRFSGGIYQVELADRNGTRLKVGRVLVQK